MKTRILLITTLLIVQLIAFGQKDGCVFGVDTTTPLSLSYEINLGTGEYVISVCKAEWEPNRHHHILLFIDSIDSFVALESTDPLSIYSYAMGDIDSSRVLSITDLSMISSMSISVWNQKSDEYVVFEDLPLINELELPNLEGLAIYVANVPREARVDVGLSKWSNYSILKKKNNLKSFYFTDKRNEYALIYPVGESLVSDLMPFTNLKKLEIPRYLNEELSNFPKLESLLYYNTEYFFAHQFANFSIKYPVYQRHGWKDFNKNNAQRMYFLNQGNHAIDTIVISKQYNLEHPNTAKMYNLEKLDSIVKLTSGSGDVTIMRHDYYSSESYHADLENDTLWDGKLENGKMVGVWKIFDISSNSYILIDFDNIGTYEMPENGYFTYYFPNGQLGIEGRMKKGKKDGVWKFYELDGKIASTKTFKNGQPKGLFVDFSPNHADYLSIIEERRYYINESGYYTAVIKDSCRTPQLYFIKQKTGKVYDMNPNSRNLIQWDYEEGREANSYSVKDKQYCKIIYREFLKKLYPKTRKKDIQFINCFCDTKN